MKTSHTKLRSSLFLSLLSISLPLWAKPIAQVTEVNGQVFVVTPAGKTASLKINDHIEEKSEVMVDEGGSITLNDYYDATYHVIGGGHIKLYEKSVQLKRGKTWIQSQTGKNPLAVTTANGYAAFDKAEFIVTFDMTNSRSQFLVVNGDINVTNILDKNLSYTVSAGQFSLIDPEVENGIPRAPTKVGLASLNSALAEFKKLPESIKIAPVAPSRSIASIEEGPSPRANSKGEIIFISTNRLPASVKDAAHGYWKKTTGPSKFPKKEDSLSTAPIKFYGTNWTKSMESSTENQQVEASRVPASIPPVDVLPTKKATPLRPDQEFSESLKNQTTNQPKFSKELENLIQDLKSY